MSVLEVTGISKSYGEVTALEDVTFSIDRKDVYRRSRPSASGSSENLRFS